MQEYVIIVAAGSGSRFGSQVPKQFCLAAGRPVLMHTIDRWRRACPGAEIKLVLSAAMTDYWYRLCRSCNFDSPAVVAGGDTRFHSVKAAVDSLKACPDDAIVYVHDGARPLVMTEVVERLRRRIAGGRHAAVPVVPVSDSLRRLTADGRSQALDRSQYVSVQTPQAFDLATLRQAYSSDYQNFFTDDASVVETVCGIAVTTVAGSPLTIKITNRPDLATVESLLADEE